ncbi:hypothetical protein FEM48_Zijuj07G0028400 [Ziziphus jujuba var. spinosa]|uniref:Uncharacterized protein n=1 Tax=Ziziphus jujuba var. spinosa TaxID=714518 RepID=A0A978V211_ZIZJJ|nr:hypothetical protein FEM48_Zijuj07G0028400 [Ziziphus jujuba var. spinosa]
MFYYKNQSCQLVTVVPLLKNDEFRPLIERVLKNEVRPVLPEMVATGLAYLDKVDAYDNDGDEIAYPVSHLIFHLDWRFGKWVSTQKYLVIVASKSFGF